MKDRAADAPGERRLSYDERVLRDPHPWVVSAPRAYRSVTVPPVDLSETAGLAAGHAPAVGGPTLRSDVVHDASRAVEQPRRAGGLRASRIGAGAQRLRPHGRRNPRRQVPRGLPDPDPFRCRREPPPPPLTGVAPYSTRHHRSASPSRGHFTTQTPTIPTSTGS